MFQAGLFSFIGARHINKNLFTCEGGKCFCENKWLHKKSVGTLNPHKYYKWNSRGKDESKVSNLYSTLGLWDQMDEHSLYYLMSNTCDFIRWKKDGLFVGNQLKLTATTCVRPCVLWPEAVCAEGTLGNKSMQTNQDPKSVTYSTAKPHATAWDTTYIQSKV